MRLSNNPMRDAKTAATPTKTADDRGPSRRGFLKLTAGATGGLVLGAMLPPRAASAAMQAGTASAPATDTLASPFVHITPDNRVIVISKHLDKGQGSASGLATLVADELDAAVEQVGVEFAPADAKLYANTLLGAQGTGGSTAIANSYVQYREAGATARAMLIAAAAAEWGVGADTITVAQGHLTSGENSASFGELARAAATQTVPDSVTLKTPEQWIYIAKGFPRVDMEAKSQGSVGMFGMDAQPENVLIAVTARPPKFGGTLASVDATEARAMPGVEAVLELPQGVAVVARNTWQAIQARDALTLEWDFSGAETRGSDQIEAEFTALLDKPGLAAGGHGDVDAALTSAASTVEADYVLPYLAHAPMEPLDITVLYDGTQAQIWTGSQLQTVDHATAASVLGLAQDKISLNTLWAGGSFGRRAVPDGHYVAEASMLAKAWLDEGRDVRPLKLVYTREDDVRGGYYRPLHMHRVRAGLDDQGRITGWDHRIVGQGIMIGTAFEAFAVKDGIDSSSLEGVEDTPYDFASFRVDVHHPDVGVPVLWWRSVGHSHSAYVMETMMDELATKAGADPVQFRLDHLTDQPRLAGVLQLAAEKAGWDRPVAEGRGRGIALHRSFNSYVAEVAEVSMREDGTVKVEKVVAAVDCGVPVNPDVIEAQIQGGIGYGLSAILRERITLTDGEVDQFNFPDYTPLRISDMPEVEVHITPSLEAPTGIGEPGLPPIGPAVANAIAQITQQRVRTLPMSLHDLA